MTFPSLLLISFQACRPGGQEPTESFPPHWLAMPGSCHSLQEMSRCLKHSVWCSFLSSSSSLGIWQMMPVCFWWPTDCTLLEHPYLKRLRAKIYLSLRSGLPNLDPGPRVQCFLNCSTLRVLPGKVTFEECCAKTARQGFCSWLLLAGVCWHRWCCLCRKEKGTATAKQKAKSLMLCKVSCVSYVGVLLIFVLLEKGRNCLPILIFDFLRQYYVAENQILFFLDLRAKQCLGAEPGPVLPK